MDHDIRREHMHEMEEVRSHLRDAEEKLRERDTIIQTLRLRVEEEVTRANAAEEERDRARHEAQDVRDELGEEKRSADMAIKRLEATRDVARSSSHDWESRWRVVYRRVLALRTAVKAARARAQDAEDEAKHHRHDADVLVEKVRNLEEGLGAELQHPH